MIKGLTSTVKQAWYADDAAATGKIASLRTWWDEIFRLVPIYGTMQIGQRPGLLPKRSLNDRLA